MNSVLVRSKVLQPVDAEVDPLTYKVAEALIDLEAQVPELRAEMKSLHFYTAMEVEVFTGRKAIVLYVPVPELKAYRKLSSRLIRELEKKFSEKHVIILARRKILPKPKKGANVKIRRLRSRTLTAVHEATLEDIVHPVEIIGKRIRVKRDGSRLIKVILDVKDKMNVEYKLDTFTSVYRKLTGKNVAFEFASSSLD